MTIPMWIATFAWVSLVLGYRLRYNRKLHVTFALLGISTDIGLVLFLQFTRKAVQTALSFSLETMQQIHIVFSLTALLLYVPVLVLGFTLLRGKGTPRTKIIHIRLAITTLLLRTLGFVFMFSMLGEAQKIGH